MRKELRNGELLQGQAYLLAREYRWAFIQKRYVEKIVENLFFTKIFHKKILGDFIKLVKKVDGAWWEGELIKKGATSSRGWFPSNYVRELKPSEIDKLKKEKGLE